MTKRSTIRFGGIAALAASAMLLTACATEPASTGGGAVPVESIAQSRVALTYDGGILVLDGTTLETLGDLPLDGFNRLNPAGDGTTVLVSTTEGFRVLDTGAAASTDPVLTDLVFDAPTPGHVVRHAGKTILFSDGTGEITILDSADLRADALPESETVASENAHHGVAIELADGTLLSTITSGDSRVGARALDADRTEVTRSEDCPGVHGEGAAADEIAVFGCNDGVLIYDGGEFTKVSAPDAYGRTGNIFVTEASTIAAGDYNSDPDSEGYLLTQLAFIDTVAKSLQVVNLPEGAAYTFRDLGRGPNDEVLVLSSDGLLYVLDPETGAIVESFPVIEAWDGPVEWQDAHPTLIVSGGTAYVTEPASNSLHAVDIATGEILATVDLGETPIELAAVTG